MKKISSVLILVLTIRFIAEGQSGNLWNAVSGTSHIYKTVTDGNVGIGTSNPQNYIFQAGFLFMNPKHRDKALQE